MGSKWHKLRTLAFSEGSLGLRSALRSRQSAYWAPWADCLKLMHERHSAFTNRFVHAFGHVVQSNSVVTNLRNCNINLSSLGAEIPSWNVLRTESSRSIISKSARNLEFINLGGSIKLRRLLRVALNAIVGPTFLDLNERMFGS